jgi:hypothetical protein
MRSRLGALLALIVLVASPACDRAGGASAASADAGRASPDAGLPASSPDPLGPPSQAELSTTPGADALANLDGQIGVLEGLIKSQTVATGQVASRQQVVPLLLARSKYLGRVADAERAAALADGLMLDRPGERWAWELRASTRAAMHLFAAALADLKEAEKLGTPAADLVAPRAAILEGQGDLDGALALRRAASAGNPDLSNLGLEASLLGLMGRADEARDLFRRAAARHRNPSPFPLAWLFLQEGLFWERAGDTDRARAYYAAAHERLPAYGHAPSHLATLVPPARGIELLLPIVAASDDPEFELILAGRLRAAGQAAEAEARLAHVRARYAELAERHPEAYAEHAGFFLLDEGREPERTLLLARVNLAVRRTEKSYQLALLAALAAGKRDEACTLGAQAQRLPYAGEMLRSIAAGACRDP